MGDQREWRLRGPGVTAGIAAIAIAASTLTGCTLVEDGDRVLGILQEEAAQQEVLKATLKQLRELGGVEKAMSRFLADGPHGDEVDINLVATSAATSTELTAMAVAVREAFTNSDLQQAVPLFTLEIADGGTLTQSTFDLTPGQLEAEVGYWVATEDAIGETLSLDLVQSGGEPPYQRQFRPASAAGAMHATDQFIANYEALLAAPDQTSASTWWSLPGLGFQPDLPPAGVVTLLASIRDTAPLIDYTGTPDDPPADYEYPQGAAVSWYPMGPERVKTAAATYYQNELRESDWSTVLEVAALAATARTEFAYSAGEHQYRFYSDKCEGTADATDDDRMLVESLAQAGTVLPAGGGAGFCMPKPPQ